ncbi:hypothetical protein SLEP1_g22437 [Rubroshorea leprosula]|uniref:Uncharacterized protein n=1 Tax=Rubroshorea leprosula TaxID=152421 RepID=A0AAV5JF92_9ROSI|nr:hypothetical protein SLEP1_g22437 [Rubroshorea leprosula]
MMMSHDVARQIMGYLSKSKTLWKVKGNEEKEEVVAGFDFKPNTPTGFNFKPNTPARFNRSSDYWGSKKPNCARFL